MRIYTLRPFASHETAVELVLAVEEDVVPPDRADMGAQRREAAIGCHILNRMTELGRPSSYALGR